MNTQFATVVELEGKVSAATGTARQVFLDKLRSELKRLEGLGELTACQVQDRMKTWLDDAEDDQFDNMPV